MELKVREVRQIDQKSEANTQITFDEDYNVPDAKPDVGRMIQKKGEIMLGEAQVSEGRVRLTGSLIFHLLYVGDGQEKHIYSMDGELPLDESLNLEGLTSGDKVCIKWEMEDLNIHLINSRKLNVRGVVAFSATVDEMKNISIPLELSGEEQVSVQKKEMNLLELGVHKKDTLRIKKELTLASNKPSIHAFLWKDIQIRALDIRCGENMIDARGELFVFVLYAGDDEDHPLQYLEQAIPWQQRIECAGCSTEMIPDIDTSMMQGNMEAAPDADGEERVLQVDVVLELDMKLYQEQHFSILSDIYHPGRRLLPRRSEQKLSSLLVNNHSKCRVVDKVPVPEGANRVLQICHSEGKVKIDSCRLARDGIYVEGIVELRILYIISDDEMPFYSMETAVPFTHLVEAPDITPGCRYFLHSAIEQLSTTMLDSSDIEVKALLAVNALVLQQQTEQIITGVEEEEADQEEIQNLPGIVCYLVQEGDTLWNIAKTFHTTVADIQELNEDVREPLQPMTSLLLVKKVE
ncbi:MAG: DUF3794 domain-containing protein [Lachnospiraceae bacterium]|nr:DUF3794 domain-containing protein [Lachnospiraceae bacterium]